MALTIVLSCSQKRYLKNTNQEKEMFEIIKITKKNDFFISEAKRNDSVFTIISIYNADNINVNSKRIKKGDKFSFHIKKIFPPNNLISFAEVRSFRFGNNNIKLNERNHWSVYIDTVLNGTYIP